MGASYQPPQWLVPNMGPGNINKVGNYSFQFDGIADYIDTGYTGAVTSCSLWFKPDATVTTGAFGGTLMGFEDGGQYSGIYLGSTVSAISDELITVFSNGSILNKSYYSQVGGTINTDWHHLVISGTGTQYNIYLDNVNVFTANYNGDVGLITATRFDIGCRILSGVINSPFPGLISEIAVFNYELEAGDVTTLYGDAANGVGNPMALASPPVAYYKGDRAGFGDEWAVPNQVNYDQVFEFDAADYISTSHISLSSAFSVSAWVNTTDTNTYGNIFSSDEVPTGGTTRNWQFIRWNNKARFILRNSSGSAIADIDGGTINDGNWHHVLATWDGTTGTNKVQLYVDGNSVDQGTASSTALANSAIPMVMGGSSATWDFIGKMSNIAIWNSDQTANKDNIYNNGTPGNLTSLSPTAWWKLNQSTSAWNGTSWDFQNSAT